MPSMKTGRPKLKENRKGGCAWNTYSVTESIYWFLWHDSCPIYSHPENSYTSISSQF